jgi:hypothetical protein
MQQQLRSALKSAIGGALLGGAVYVGADLASDVYTVGVLRRQSLALAQQHAELRALLGAAADSPLQPGPLWQSTLAFAQGGHVAHCTFPVAGPAAGTDIVMRAARRPGYRSTFLYNFVGPGEWDVLTCSAMFPGAGGLAQARSLLPKPEVSVEAAAQAARVRRPGAAGGGGDAHCAPCEQQRQAAVQPSRRRPPGQETAGGRVPHEAEQASAAAGKQQPGRRRWWWPFGGRGGAGAGAPSSSTSTQPPP